MCKIVLVGAKGKMCQVVTDYIKGLDHVTVVAGLDLKSDNSGPFPIYSAPQEVVETADVVLDFSGAFGLENSLALAKQKKLPLVLAATGYSEEQLAMLEQESTKLPIFRSSNMSLGINLILELAQKAAATLGQTFDIEIVEKHHNRKVDAPSGTAIMIADAMSEVLPEQPVYQYDRHSVHEKRKKNEIGIHAVRGGNIVGEHDIIFAGTDEVLTISHAAHSREIFAVGAVRACQFMLGKVPGLYNMKDLLA